MVFGNQHGIPIRKQSKAQTTGYHWTRLLRAPINTLLRFSKSFFQPDVHNSQRHVLFPTSLKKKFSAFSAQGGCCTEPLFWEAQNQIWQLLPVRHETIWDAKAPSSDSHTPRTASLTMGATSINEDPAGVRALPSYPPSEGSEMKRPRPGRGHVLLPSHQLALRQGAKPLTGSLFSWSVLGSLTSPL